MNINQFILRKAIYQEAETLPIKAKISNVLMELFPTRTKNAGVKYASMINSLRDKRVEISSMTLAGSYQMKIKLAFNSLYKESFSPSFQPAINNAFYNELNKRGIKFDSGFNFAGFISGALRQLSPRMGRDTSEEIEQTILTKLFTAGEEGKNWFEIFKERYAADETMQNLLGKLKTTVTNLGKNWFRDEGKKTGPSYQEGMATPEQQDLDVSAIENKIENADPADEISEMEAENLAKSIEEEIESSPDTAKHSDMLIAVFNKLLQGYSKGEIATDLGFKSQSRLNYYLDILKDVVRTVAMKQGLTDLVPSLTKSLVSA